MLWELFKPEHPLRGLACGLLIALIGAQTVASLSTYQLGSRLLLWLVVTYFTLLAGVSLLLGTPRSVTALLSLWAVGRALIALAPTAAFGWISPFWLHVMQLVVEPTLRLAAAYAAFYVLRPAPIPGHRRRFTLGEVSLAVEAVEAGLVMQVALAAARVVAVVQPLWFTSLQVVKPLTAFAGVLLYAGLVWLGYRRLRRGSRPVSLAGAALLLAGWGLAANLLLLTAALAPASLPAAFTEAVLRTASYGLLITWYGLAYLLTGPRVAHTGPVRRR